MITDFCGKVVTNGIFLEKKVFLVYLLLVYWLLVDGKWLMVNGRFDRVKRFA